MSIRLLTSRCGTTAMEALCIVLIVAVMATVMLPTAGSFYATEQSYAAAAKLTADIRLARYRAIEYQCYVRLTLDPSGAGWRVEELCDSVTGDTVQGEAILPTHNRWISILDEETRENDPSINISYLPDPPQLIFFRPDGLLVSSYTFNAAPIGIQQVVFNFSSDPEAQGAQVDITPAGVIESKAYYSADY